MDKPNYYVIDNSTDTFYPCPNLGEAIEKLGDIMRHSVDVVLTQVIPVTLSATDHGGEKVELDIT